MNDIWTWVWRSLYEDEGRREWFGEWSRAMDLDETDPAGAVAILDGAIARADAARDC